VTADAWRASFAEWLARLPAEIRAEVYRELGDAEVAALGADWRFWGRPDQRPPEGEWSTWLIMAGRGWGKTRTGAEWVRLRARDPEARIALVGATLGEARSVMVEGESGLLAVCAGERVRFEPSVRRLTWGNGAKAFLYSAEEGEALRGPEHCAAWCDEIAKWKDAERAWMNLRMGLRKGDDPRAVATTTPRPTQFMRRLLAEPGVVTTRGRTFDNRAHLPPAFLAAVTAEYSGTRLGRQELDGELIEEVEGALWSRATIEQGRVRRAPELCRVVVAVDPPAGIGGDACGIVAVGLGADGRGYVLGDRSVHGLGPEGWASAVAKAVAEFEADRVVAEVNNGGAMVESVLRAVGLELAVTSVRASRGKSARAEPVAGLYAAGRVRHVGGFAEMEDEMCGLLAGGGYAGPGRSPDRADALVWGLTELMLGKTARPGVRVL